MDTPTTIIAKLRYAHIPPRKARFVADLIRGLSYEAAYTQLYLNSRRPSAPLLKLLESAKANAKNLNVDLNRLFVKEIRVDQGPKITRYTPRAQGGASPIQKKLSHVTLILGVSEKSYIEKFVLPKKVKKDKEKPHAHKKKDEHGHEIDEVGVKKETQKGFLKKVFQRKSI